MRFSTREDIEAPIDHVFRAVSNFDNFERQALRRGAEVSRIDTLGKPGVGSEWKIAAMFRGKQRKIDARITQFTPPNGLVADTSTGGLKGTVGIELVALSPRRTRLQVSIDLKPTTLTARILVQSLKIARTNVNRRFSNRVAEFAKTVQDKYQSHHA